MEKYSVLERKIEKIESEIVAAREKEAEIADFSDVLAEVAAEKWFITSFFTPASSSLSELEEQLKVLQEE